VAIDHDFPVKFGGVSIGEATARLGVSIDRSVLNIVAADELFCGHRLTGRVIRGRTGDQAGQTTFVDDFALDAVFDVKRFGANQSTISTGLTFSLPDIDLATLAKMSKGAGRLVIKAIAELPDDSPAHDDEDDDAPDESLKAEGPWAEVKLGELFKDSLLKSLNAAKLYTVGDLANFSRNPDNRLTDLEGIGPGKAEKIENRMLQFWADNPDADQQPEPEPASSDATT
jgi:hypothetical protein